MARDIDLKELEKKPYKSTFKDGFFDIFFGFVFLAFIINSSISPFLDMELRIFSYFLLFPAVIGVGATIMMGGKKRITEPRMRYAQFSAKSKGRNIKVLIIILAVLIILIILLVIINMGFSELRQYLGSLLMALIFIAFPLSLVAYFFQFKRLYFYAVMIGILVFLLELFSIFLLFPFNIILAFSIVGGSAVLTGLVLLIQFIKKYPKMEVEGV